MDRIIDVRSMRDCFRTSEGDKIIPYTYRLVNDVLLEMAEAFEILNRLRLEVSNDAGIVSNDRTRNTTVKGRGPVIIFDTNFVLVNIGNGFYDDFRINGDSRVLNVPNFVIVVIIRIRKSIY